MVQCQFYTGVLSDHFVFFLGDFHSFPSTNSHIILFSMLFFEPTAEKIEV